MRGKSIDPAQLDKAQRIINNVSNAFRMAPQLQQETVVYRGLNLANMGELGRHLLDVGFELPDKAFMSTSLLKKVAEKYAGPSGAIMRLHVPPGVRALYLETITRAQGEIELLLEPKLTVTVKHVSYAGGRPVIDVEVSHGQ